ncbi:hypothetical protein EBS02_08105, partial [bacterium]|nr:hypothetical protein [bacterium]
SIIKKAVPSNDKIKNLYDKVLSVDEESYQYLFLGKKEVDYLKRIIMKSGANSLAIKIAYKDWDPGKLTAQEILLNPATNLKIYNYLEAIKEDTKYNNFTPLLAQASQKPHVKKETMITALRSAMLPDFFEETLMSHYFSKSAYSEKTKLDIKEHMQKQKDILFAVLTAEPACREFFLNDRAIQQGLLRQELERMFNSLKDFTAYAKVKPSEEIADFQEKFVLNVSPLISQMINHPSMNLAKRLSFWNEARRASSEHSSFNRLFLETVASIMEPTLKDHIIQTKSKRLTQIDSTLLKKEIEETLRSEMLSLETKNLLRDLKQTLKGTIAEKTVTLPPPPISRSSVREAPKKSLISLAKEVMEKRARAILNSIPVGRRKKGSDTERLIK